MKTELYWLAQEANFGTLGICPRPRGNDWLKEELAHFRQSGVDVLVSALTSPEVKELELEQEPELCKEIGVIYISYPIEDRGVPDSTKSFYEMTRKLSGFVSEGKGVMIHCRQGIGRSSYIAAGILFHLGATSAEEALALLASARGRDVPDTEEQIASLRRFLLYFGV